MTEYCLGAVQLAGSAPPDPLHFQSKVLVLPDTVLGRPAEHRFTVGGVSVAMPCAVPQAPGTTGTTSKLALTVQFALIAPVR